MNQLARLLLATATILAALSSAASAQNLTPIQHQFLEAIRKSQIQKARDLVELGSIKPNNFAGEPFVKWLFMSDGQLNGLTDEAFDYTFKELKQPFTVRAGRRGNVPVFALFCENTGAATSDRRSNISGLERTQARMMFALGNGASVQPVPGVAWGLRDDQPLPRCVREYAVWRSDPKSRTMMLDIIAALIKHGADPQYDLPITKAAEAFDIPLLKTMVANGARVDRVFPVTGEIDTTCGKHSYPDNTIVAKLPHPSDRDIPVAQPFLEALLEAGVDIMEPQHFVHFSAMKCLHQHVTLVDRALPTGQTAYAKMVLALSKSKVVQPTATTAARPPFQTAQPTLTGSRIVTAEFNVREQPSPTAALMSTLGPNTVFDIEEASPDGQWHRINAVPIVRGWANTAVILKSSAPNAAAP